jgi:hypothetical protein
MDNRVSQLLIENRYLVKQLKEQKKELLKILIDNDNLKSENVYLKYKINKTKRKLDIILLNFK